MPVTRTHAAAGVLSEALWSDCGSYRFRLTRRWGEGAGLVCILLNPSTATEAQEDPTLRRCMARARAAGLPALTVVNLFAFCATRPADLRQADDPLGHGNDAVLHEAAAGAAMVLCGWGNHGAYLGRGAAVTASLRGAGAPLHHLGLTQEGAPRHPLYVADAVTPVPWTA